MKHAHAFLQTLFTVGFGDLSPFSGYPERCTTGVEVGVRASFRRRYGVRFCCIVMSIIDLRFGVGSVYRWSTQWFLWCSASWCKCLNIFFELAKIRIRCAYSFIWILASNRHCQFPIFQPLGRYCKYDFAVYVPRLHSLTFQAKGTDPVTYTLHKQECSILRCFAHSQHDPFPSVLCMRICSMTLSSAT